MGIYDLRLADAHLPASDLADAYKLARVDPNAPLISQGLSDPAVLCVSADRHSGGTRGLHVSQRADLNPRVDLALNALVSRIYASIARVNGQPPSTPRFCTSIRDSNRCICQAVI